MRKRKFFVNDSTSADIFRVAEFYVDFVTGSTNLAPSLHKTIIVMESM